MLSAFLEYVGISFPFFFLLPFANNEGNFHEGKEDRKRIIFMFGARCFDNLFQRRLQCIFRDRPSLGE